MAKIEITDMLSKIKLLVSSLRFWIIITTAVLAVLQEVAGDGLTIAELLGIGQVAFAAIVALGTFDSVATRLSAGKK